MKTALFVLCFLCAAMAFGQSSVTPLVTSNVQFSDHAQRATPQGLGREESLTQTFGTVYVEHGEMPLSEVRLPVVHVVPLGDLARALKKEHAADKKALVVWEN